MKIAPRLLAVIVSLLVALVAAEVLFRVLDPYGVSYYGEVERYLRDAIEEAPAEFHAEGRIFQNRPGVDLELRRFRYRTDGRRLRRGATKLDDEAGALRILFLGDSVTLAWGVDDEDSWVRRIERYGTSPDGRRLHCMNSGHLMYDTVQEAALLRAWGPALAPDVVVLCFVFNDVQPTWNQIQELTANHSLPAGAR